MEKEQEYREEETLLEWEAEERIFVKRSKKYFKNLFAILFILAAVAIFFRQFVLAAVFGGFGFLQYALGTVPPGKTKHRITTSGLHTFGRDYTWDELTGFWFSRSNGKDILHVNTKHSFPRRLFLLLGDQEKKKVSSVLRKYIPLQRPPEDHLEKLSKKFSRHFRL